MVYFVSLAFRFELQKRLFNERQYLFCFRLTIICLQIILLQLVINDLAFTALVISPFGPDHMKAKDAS